MFLRIFIILALSVVTSLKGKCSNADYECQTTPRLTILSHIIKHNAEVVVDLQENRLYLNIQHIRSTTDGIAVDLENTTEKLLLPEIYEDHLGYFILCSYDDLLAITSSDDLRTWWCPTCKAFRKMTKYQHCSVCGRKL